jgi:NADH-quinone oxidoreductase subunit N
MMPYGFSLLYGLTGTLDLEGIGARVLRIAHVGPTWQLAVGLSALLTLCGFGHKAAAVPFHSWCPDVYQGAPTPFAAFLSVGPKAAGLAALLRFVLVGFGRPIDWAEPGAFPWPAILGGLAVATMTLGNLVAIAQDNVKRLLAYSSIAQAGYMLMAVAVGSGEAIRAVVFYLAVYLVMNLGAFLAVIAVRERTGSESLADYRGLGSRSPYLAVVLAVFLFSLTGLPPLAGFIGKFYLFAALLRAESPFFYVVALIGVVNSAVSLYYYARVVKAMYLEQAEGEAPALPLSVAHAAFLTLLAVPTIVLGLWWAPLAEAAERAAAGLV